MTNRSALFFDFIECSIQLLHICRGDGLCDLLQNGAQRCACHLTFHLRRHFYIFCNIPIGVGCLNHIEGLSAFVETDFSDKGSIYITENSLSCTDCIHLDGKVHDPARIDFIHRYLLALRRAVDSGVDVRGYFHWSLLDNFEWSEGYNERFGLIYLDYATGKRTPKDSASWYARVSRNEREKSIKRYDSTPCREVVFSGGSGAVSRLLIRIRPSSDSAFYKEMPGAT